MLNCLKNLPGYDLLDISEYLGGRWLKAFVGIAYITMFVFVSTTILRYFSEKLKLIYFHITPNIVILLIFLVGAVIINKIGAKSIIQINILIVSALLISILITILSVTSLYDFNLLFPILGNGINETFFSGLSNLFAFEGLAYLFFLMPLLKDTKDFKKISITATIISGIYLFLSVTCLLLVFSYVYKTEEILLLYSLARLAEFGDFIQRTDALFILIWILSVFSYVSVSLFFASHIFKKLTNASNIKAILYPLATLMLGLAFVVSNIADSITLQRIPLKFFQLGLILIISPAILILANIKQKFKKGVFQPHGKN